jgi:hypothetical protein
MIVGPWRQDHKPYMPFSDAHRTLNQYIIVDHGMNQRVIVTYLSLKGTLRSRNPRRLENHCRARCSRVQHGHSLSSRRALFIVNYTSNFDRDSKGFQWFRPCYFVCPWRKFFCFDVIALMPDLHTCYDHVPSPQWIARIHDVWSSMDTAYFVIRAEGRTNQTLAAAIADAQNLARSYMTWHDIVTLDELRFYLSTNHEFSWLSHGKNVPEQARHTIKSKKVMLTIVWAPCGFYLINGHANERKFNSNHYITESLSPLS